MPGARQLRRNSLSDDPKMGRPLVVQQRRGIAQPSHPRRQASARAQTQMQRLYLHGVGKLLRNPRKSQRASLVSRAEKNPTHITVIEWLRIASITMKTQAQPAKIILLHLERT